MPRVDEAWGGRVVIDREMMMDSTVFVVFVFVYLGMFLGEIPGLALDRAGVALLGAIALLVSEKVTPEAA